MHPKSTLGRSRFDSDERAVTPVISIVLVVALTTILAALVGTNALGLANHSATAAPNVAFHTHWEGGDTLVVEHQSGGAVDTARITIYVDGMAAPAYDGGVAGDGVTVSGWSGDEIRAGDTIELTSAAFTGEGFAVYYEWDGRSFVLSED